ncbi:MAG: discoidin domain-containing protein [Bryobacteraceae bacterium]
MLLPRTTARLAPHLPDPVVQSTPGRMINIPSPATNFDGIGDGVAGFRVGSAPPDTNLTVGPNHLVEMVNTDLAIYNKSGVLLQGPLSINTLWQGFGGLCQADNDGDPVVRYDSIADRFVVTQFALNSTNFLECVAVSATSDPTGAYNRYAFAYSALNDYPKLAVWPDAYYITYNMFDSSGTSFLGSKVCALDRTRMLAGQAATQHCFDTSTSFGGLLPSDFSGSRLPPLGAPNHVLALGAMNGQLAFWNFHVDWITPANSSFTGPTVLTAAAFTEACGGGTCIPQSGTSQQLDSLGDRLMFRLVYRNFGDRESLVVNHSVDVGGHAGARWYELRLDAAGNPSIFQQSTYAPDSNHRWMGSIAIDQSGNLGLGYSLSSATLQPQIRYTGRLVTDPLSIMAQGEATLFAGNGSQTGGNLSRWGDYSSMDIDPADGCTFWYTTEYIPANGAFNWRTRIASFRFPSCGGTAPAISKSAGDGQSATIGQPFGSPLQVTVKDGSQNAVPGATVSFAAPSSGASGTFPGGALTATAITNASGIAISPTFTAGTIPGSYNVSASVGALAPVNFTLSNVSGAPASNLALGKAATQSSTYPFTGAGAGSAVDGNTDGNFQDNSVTATNMEANAWWQVDLGAPATVNSIVIWNRTDCCANRLSDYWVFVSNTPFNPSDTPATLQNRAGTWSSHQTTAPNPSTTIAAGGVQGRYVRVQLTGTDFLSLAEVQVIGTGGAPSGSNLALGKAATQSSTYPFTGAGAGSAVDGNTDGNFQDNSVTATNMEANAWWQVDLGASATVNSIVIWNRTDCCSNRLSDYWVFVSNTPFNPSDTPATLQNRAGTWSSHQTTAPNPSTTIAAGGVQGRYVRVQLTGTDFLSLAEVQVVGTGGAPSGSNLALGKTASQSSTYPSSGASAGSAVDGNTDGNFQDNSVTATNMEANAWWQVDLGASATVNSIVIWNRRDCCAYRLSDYWVFVSNTPFSPSDTPATLQNRAGTWSSHQTAAPNPSTTIAAGGAQGRYVRVQLTGTDFLSLAEVQAIGTTP